MRFAGQYYDHETGLHYNYHRYYDPKLGRYLRADPIGLAGGINPYVYVQNNPLNAIDPWGLHDRPFKHSHSGEPADYYAISNKLTGHITFTKEYDDLHPLKKESVDHHEKTHIKHPFWSEERVLKDEVEFNQKQIDELKQDDPNRQVLEKWKKSNERMWKKEKDKKKKKGKDGRKEVGIYGEENCN